MPTSIAPATIGTVVNDLVALSPVASRFNPDHELVILPVTPRDDDDPLYDDDEFSSLINRPGRNGSLSRISLPSEYRSLNSSLPFPPRFLSRIGQSGWDYVNKQVTYVPLDIDLVDDHESTGTTADELEQLAAGLSAIPCCEVRRSTSGGGLHVVVYLAVPILAETRQGYTATIDRVIELLDQQWGLSLRDKIDTTAAGRGVLWLWAPQLNERSFELLSPATERLDLCDWQPPAQSEPQQSITIGFDLEGVLRRNNVHFTTKRYDKADNGIGYVVKCPWHNHEGNETKTMVWRQGGVPCFNCFADKCKAKTWKDFAKETCPDAMLSPGCFAVLRVLHLAMKQDEYFHDREGDAFVVVKGDTYYVASQHYADVLRLRYREATGQSIGKEHLNQAIDELRAHTRLNCPQHEVFRRVGKYLGKHYLDLCDKDRHVIEIDTDGWHIRNAADIPGIRFLRPTKFLPIPIPERGGAIDALWHYVTVSPEDRPLVLAWLLGAMRIDLPCAVLLLIGEAGTAKTSNGSFLASIINPLISEEGKTYALLSFPRNEKDLYVTAKNNWTFALDNVGKLSKEMSDALCCIVTGVADESRKFFTNNDESRFLVRRPVLITSVGQIVSEPDLADRTLTIELPTLATRLLESQLWSEFERDRSKILGALLDAFVIGLRGSESTPPDVRLQDFGKFVQDAENVFGYQTGTTVAAMRRVQAAASEGAVNESPLAKAIVAHVQCGEFVGTAKQLREALVSGDWPDGDVKFANAFKRIIPDLQKIGLDITSGPLHGRTTYTIKTGPTVPASPIQTPVGGGGQF